MRKYGFLALMRNIFPFHHSIPWNCKKVDSKRMFDIGKERCQSFVNMKILWVCVCTVLSSFRFPTLTFLNCSSSVVDHVEAFVKNNKLKGKRSDRLFIFRRRTKKLFIARITTLHRLLFSCCRKREVVICHYFVKTLFLSNSICILWWETLETRTNKPTNWISFR